MRIGVLYICIGKYDFFWKDFYLSAEGNLMKDTPCTKEYYVFTDSLSIYGENENKRIHRIEQANLGWPDNTMMRYQMFLRIKEQLLKDTDYLYFFNANAQIMLPIGKEILPTAADNNLVGVLNPYVNYRHKWNFTYERRSKSAVYIPYWKGTNYYQGSFWGGTTSAFLSLCETCKKWIDIDKLNGIIPIWHDESALNCYFIDYPPKALGYGYSWGGGAPVFCDEIKVLLRKKTDYFSMKELCRDEYSKVEACGYRPTILVRGCLKFLNLLFGYNKKKA